MLGGSGLTEHQNGLEASFQRCFSTLVHLKPSMSTRIVWPGVTHSAKSVLVHPINICSLPTLVRDAGTGSVLE